MKKLLRVLPSLILAALLPTSLVRAQTYPTKPIRMIVPYTPGGSIDTVGRLVADQLQKQMGQAFVIENRPGASGMIGAQEAARAPADGYTLLFNASSQVYLPLVVSKKTYDAEKDFTPVAQVGYVPLAVVTNPAVGASSLAEFAALSRAHPKKYTWATSGLGTTSHLTEEIINRELKLDMEIVLYKGAVPQLTDVMGGHVSAAVSPMPGVTPFLKSGKLRPIAVTSSKRLASLPDVPTVAESGIPGFELLSWYGLWGAANMPRAVVDRLSTQLVQVVREAARADDEHAVGCQRRERGSWSPGGRRVDVHRHRPLEHRHVGRGKQVPQAALAAAAVKVDQQYVIPRENHNPIEMHATIAAWEGDRLTLWDKTRWVHNTAEEIAAVFGTPAQNVRVVSPFVGGAFGSALRTWPT